MMPTTSNEVMTRFADSVLLILNQLKEKDEELRKINETERTKIHYTQKMIKDWFYKNGAM